MPTICRVAEIQIHDVCALRMNARGALLDAADLHLRGCYASQAAGERPIYTHRSADYVASAKKKTCRSRAIDFCAKRYLYVRDPHRQIDGLESFTLATHRAEVSILHV
jgi:hypothetical protein